MNPIQTGRQIKEQIKEGRQRPERDVESNARHDVMSKDDTVKKATIAGDQDTVSSEEPAQHRSSVDRHLDMIYNLHYTYMNPCRGRIKSWHMQLGDFRRRFVTLCFYRMMSITILSSSTTETRSRALIIQHI